MYCRAPRAESMRTLRGCSSPLETLLFGQCDVEVTDGKIGHVLLHRVLCATPVPAVSLVMIQYNVSSMRSTLSLMRRTKVHLLLLHPSTTSLLRPCPSPWFLLSLLMMCVLPRVHVAMLRRPESLAE